MPRPSLRPREPFLTWTGQFASSFCNNMVQVYRYSMMRVIDSFMNVRSNVMTQVIVAISPLHVCPTQRTFRMHL